MAFSSWEFVTSCLKKPEIIGINPIFFEIVNRKKRLWNPSAAAFITCYTKLRASVSRTQAMASHFVEEASIWSRLPRLFLLR